jgi:hypothetical protein
MLRRDPANPGAVTYDILPTDGAHYRTAANMEAYAARWAAAILCGVYGRRDMAGPELISLRRGPGSRLVFAYNQPVVLKSWDGRPGTLAEGIRFADGDRVLPDVQVVSSRVEGMKVIVDIKGGLPLNLRVDYGSGADGQGKVTMRSAATGLPVPMIFGWRVAKP